MSDGAQTPADGQLGAMGAQLSQILVEQGKQSTQLAVITTKLDSLTGSATDHESRIRILEQFKYKLMGAAVTSGIVSSGVAALIVWALEHH